MKLLARTLLPTLICLLLSSLSFASDAEVFHCTSEISPGTDQPGLTAKIYGDSIYFSRIEVKTETFSSGLPLLESVTMDPNLNGVQHNFSGFLPNAYWVQLYIPHQKRETNDFVAVITYGLGKRGGSHNVLCVSF